MQSPPDPLPGFDGLYGLEILEISDERMRGRVVVRDELKQPYGLVHGGTYCTAVESAASIAAAVWFGDRGRVVGVSNSTDFYRAVTEGTLRATATPVHRGRSQQVWRVAVTDEQDRLVAQGQVRLQNLATPDRGPGH